MLPQDPMILLSYINTALRDHYGSLEELCTEMNISRDEIVQKLRGIDYEYDEEQNRFI